MTDLADYLSESVREEHIRQVRKKINELSIDYIYSQYISITGRIMGKAIPATHWERLALRACKLGWVESLTYFLIDEVI